jgi:23S rRNA (cytosine1962-C5)-methyltransferase
VNLPSEYELLDFGESEKLESFAGTVVRRETPSANGRRRPSDMWSSFDLRCQNRADAIRWEGRPPEHWRAKFCDLKFNLRPTPTGQVGVFPEQEVNWTWIFDSRSEWEGLRALNLFAYTGGTTMALARRGVQVAHVDSARSVVNWARQNAIDSGLEKAPIRWIVEDAMTFVEREIKRGNRYDIVVADPPSFGRGPKGESWKIQKDLRRLLDGLAELTADRCRMALISCHTPGFDHRNLEAVATESCGLV